MTRRDFLLCITFTGNVLFSVNPYLLDACTYILFRVDHTTGFHVVGVALKDEVCVSTIMLQRYLCPVEFWYVSIRTGEARAVSHRERKEADGTRDRYV